MQFNAKYPYYNLTFVASDNRFKFCRKIKFANNLSELFDAIIFRFGHIILQNCFQTKALFGYKFKMTTIKLRKYFDVGYDKGTFAEDV